MRLAMPFDPNEIGKIDTFAFDFTADLGAATMVSTNWTCGVAPFETATDPVPQSRVLSVSTQTAIQLRTPIDGLLQTRTGFFSVASIGGMPITAAGGTYIRGKIESEVVDFADFDRIKWRFQAHSRVPRWPLSGDREDEAFHGQNCAHTMVPDTCAVR